MEKDTNCVDGNAINRLACNCMNAKTNETCYLNSKQIIYSYDKQVENNILKCTYHQANQGIRFDQNISILFNGLYLIET